MARTRKKWQRARRPEQKEERRSAILEAATSLLDENGLEGTGLNAIARESGVSKPNIYRYFESREAILLQLLLIEQNSWVRALTRRVKPLADSNDPRAAARAFASSIVKRPRFWTLVGALASVLEHNVGLDTATEFKRQLYSEYEPAVAAWHAAVPDLSEEEAYSSLTMLVMAASGTWPHCNPAPVIQEVLTLPEFASRRVDFKATMAAHAEALLCGLLLQR